MTRSPRRLKEQVRETVSELPIHAARLAVMGVGQALLLTDRVRKDYKEVRESGIGPVLGRLRDDAENLTGRLVGMVAGHAGEEEARADGRGAARPASSEIAVGKPSAAGRTRPKGGPKEPSAAAPRKRSTATGKPAASRTTGRTTAASRTEGKPAAPSRTRDEDTTTRTAPGDGGTTPGAVAEPAVKAPAAAEGDRPTAPVEGSGSAARRAAEAAAPRPPAKAAPEPGLGAAAARELPIIDYDSASIASVRARLRNLSTRQVNELRDYERAHAARAEFLRMYENRIAKLRAGG